MKFTITTDQGEVLVHETLMKDETIVTSLDDLDLTPASLAKTFTNHFEDEIQSTMRMIKARVDAGRDVSGNERERVAPLSAIRNIVRDGDES